MRLARYGFLFCALILSVLATTSLKAEPIFPRSSGVGLEPPGKMRVSDDFLGFQQGRASILITELPQEAFGKVGGMRGAMAAQLEGGVSADFSAGGATGFIVRGRQVVDGRTFRKWAVVLAGPGQTAMVTAQVPVEDRRIADQSVETALQSIAFREPSSEADKIARLPFTVGDYAGFRARGTLAGATLLLTQGPKEMDPDITQPSIAIATSLNHAAPADGRLAYAESYLRALTALKNQRIVGAKLLQSGGAEWAEIEAVGTRGSRDVPVKTTLFMRFNATRDSIAVLCTAPVSDQTDYAERFRRLAMSVKPKD